MYINGTEVKTFFKYYIVMKGNYKGLKFLGHRNVRL
jgi:hypothetical protein